MSDIIIQQDPNILKAKIVAKCKKDFLFFMENFVYIETNENGIPGIYQFHAHDYQKKFLNLVNDNLFTIVVKGRQLGFSTAICVYCAWLLLFNDSYKIIVISKDRDSAKDIVSRVKLIIDKLPSFLKPSKFKENNVFSLTLPNSSNIKSLSTSKKSGRSFTPNLLIMDEGAFIPNLNEVLTASMPSLSRSNGKCLILSTPNGPSGTYYEYFKNAELDVNEFKYLYCYWWENPDYMFDAVQDPEFPGGWRSSWAEKEYNRLNRDKIRFLQEYCCSFNVSGDQYFPGETMDKIRSNDIKDPMFMTNFEIFNDFDYDDRIKNEFWIWKGPQEGSQYLIAADIGKGGKGDYSTFHVIDQLTCEQIGEYKGHIDTIIFAEFLVYVARKYNNALLVPENNGIGWGTVNHIVHMQYENLMYTPKNFYDLFKQNYVYNQYDKDRNGAGWVTSNKTRPLVLSNLKDSLVNRDCTVTSVRLLNELESFIFVNNVRAEAKRGTHDDLVIPFAFGMFVRNILVSQQGVDLKTMGIFANQLRHENKTFDMQTEYGNKFNTQGSIQEQLKYVDWSWMQR